MNDRSFCVLVNGENCLQANWGDQAIFHEIANDNLYLVTAQTAELLNNAARPAVSEAELRSALRLVFQGIILTDAECDNYINALVDQRLIKQLRR